MVKRREATPPQPARGKTPPPNPSREKEIDDLYAALGDQGGFGDADAARGQFAAADGDDAFFTADEDSFDTPRPRRRFGRGGPRRPRAPGRRSALSPAVVLGAVPVALLAAAVFFALGVGVNFGLRAAGLDLGVLLRDNLGVTFPPPAAVVSADAPAGEQSASPTAEPAVASLCPEAEAWWAVNAQTFAAFTSIYYRIEFFALPEDAPRALESARARIEAASAEPEPAPCLIAPRAQMRGGMEGMARALETLVSGGDRAAARAQADSAFETLTATLPLLWDLGVSTSPDSPVAAGIVRGGTLECSAIAAAGPWWAGASERAAAFETSARALDFGTMPNTRIAQALAVLQAERSNTAALAPEGCAAGLAVLLTTAQDGYIAAVGSALAGEIEPARASLSTYWSNTAVLRAWLGWLGIA